MGYKHADLLNYAKTKLIMKDAPSVKKATKFSELTPTKQKIVRDEYKKFIAKQKKKEAKKSAPKPAPKPAPKDDKTITIVRNPDGVHSKEREKKYKAELGEIKTENGKQYYRIKGVPKVYIQKKAYDDGIRTYDDPYSNSNFSGNIISNDSKRILDLPYKTKDGMGILQYYERGLSANQVKKLNKLPKV